MVSKYRPKFTKHTVYPRDGTLKHTVQCIPYGRARDLPGVEEAQTATPPVACVFTVDAVLSVALKKLSNWAAFVLLVLEASASTQR